MNNQSLLLIVIISVLIGILLVILYINLTIKTKRVLRAENEEALLALQRERSEGLEEKMRLKEQKEQEEMKHDIKNTAIDKDMILKDYIEENVEVEQEVAEEEMIDEEMINEEKLNEVIDEIVLAGTENADVMEVKEDSEQTIYKGTVLGVETFINGELLVEGDLEILGSIKGDVTCSGEVEVLGKIEGDIHAHSLYVWANIISGNLYCEDLFQNAEKTIIQGNVNARNAEIEGTIEGDLVIEDTLVLGKNSVVTGNIETGEIEISRGAILCGKILIKKNPNNI